MKTSDFELSQVKEAQVPAPDHIVQAVHGFSEKVGYKFEVSDCPVEGTELYVVYAEAHPLPERYTVALGVLGFRVPRNIPDACPEDCFFIQPHDVKLKEADPVRNSKDINRASSNQDFLRGTKLGGTPALVFSWHLWDRRPWDRNRHTLIDHYDHCIRRFDQPEHD